jgi:hypothetical protein
MLVHRAPCIDRRALEVCELALSQLRADFPD